MDLAKPKIHPRRRASNQQPRANRTARSTSQPLRTSRESQAGISGGCIHEHFQFASGNSIYGSLLKQKKEQPRNFLLPPFLAGSARIHLSGHARSDDSAKEARHRTHSRGLHILPKGNVYIGHETPSRFETLNVISLIVTPFAVGHAHQRQVVQDQKLRSTGIL